MICTHRRSVSVGRGPRLRARFESNGSQEKDLGEDQVKERETRQEGYDVVTKKKTVGGRRSPREQWVEWVVRPNYHD